MIWDKDFFVTEAMVGNELSNGLAVVCCYGKRCEKDGGGEGSLIMLVLISVTPSYLALRKTRSRAYHESDDTR